MIVHQNSLKGLNDRYSFTLLSGREALTLLHNLEQSRIRARLDVANGSKIPEQEHPRN